jgi:hypothetical protein
MGRKEIRTLFWWRNLKEKGRLEDFDVDEEIVAWAGLCSCDWGQGHVAKSYKLSDELGTWYIQTSFWLSLFLSSNLMVARKPQQNGSDFVDHSVPWR